MSRSTPQICYLAHAGFRMLGEPVFRLSEGTRVPSMVIQHEGQDAVLPLQAVAREFKVLPDSPDGQMLSLIEQALDFVVAVRIGDKLPSELNGGEASWEPNEQDRKLAASRVQHNLVRCIFAREGKTVAIIGGATPGWENHAENRLLLAEAVTAATAALGCERESDVTARVGSVSTEMAYIEAMRRTLARGIHTVRHKLLRLHIDAVPASQRETVKQVQTLARRGINEIQARFDAIDVRLDDILAMLRDVSAEVAALRRQRDWLFRTNRAWGVVFTDCDAAPQHVDEFMLKVIERIYVFLAPRYMSFQDWTALEGKLRKSALRAKVW